MLTPTKYKLTYPLIVQLSFTSPSIHFPVTVVAVRFVLIPCDNVKHTYGERVNASNAG